LRVLAALNSTLTKRHGGNDAGREARLNFEDHKLIGDCWQAKVSGAQIGAAEKVPKLPRTYPTQIELQHSQPIRHCTCQIHRWRCAGAGNERFPVQSVPDMTITRNLSVEQIHLAGSSRLPISSCCASVRALAFQVGRLLS
jgi:hypothetical protein